jgi:hypothetical protein
VRRVVQEAIAPLTAANRLPRGRSRADLRPGHAFTADDMTVNAYGWSEWPTCRMVSDVNVSHVTTMMGHSATIRHGLGVNIKGYDCMDIYGRSATLKVTSVDLNTVRVEVDRSFLMRMMPMVYRVALVGPWSRLTLVRWQQEKISTS